MNIPGGQTFTLMGTGSTDHGGRHRQLLQQPDFISGGHVREPADRPRDRGHSKSHGFTNSGTINANIRPRHKQPAASIGPAGASTNTGTIEATQRRSLVIGSTTINNIGGTIEGKRREL